MPTTSYLALPVDVMGPDCTNGGVTSKVERALLVCGPTVPDGLRDTPDCPILVLSKGWGKRGLMAHPPKGPGMFGGRFVYTSDSRFPSDQPIHVHDRFER